MTRIVLHASSVFTAAFVVLLTIAVAANCNVALASEPLTGDCVNCACWYGTGEECALDTDPYSPCTTGVSCACDGNFECYY